ncbi:MAG: glycosyl transferase family 1 [Alphaproteobacteria bacterium]|nr:glycosyl transferase family 1 [Alphaproteobacteria bacterium]
MNILYLVHDLSDAAVAKRVAMLTDGGADVRVAGFCRAVTPPDKIAGCPALSFGQTHNGGFAQRTFSVLREAATLSRHREIFAAPDIIIARTLEMLALAVRGQGFRAPPTPIIYESLDIHRLLLKNGPVGQALRTIEQRLAARTAGLITSSPAFTYEYFHKCTNISGPIRLIENKVYRHEVPAPQNPPRIPGPPWKIGWFGALRCFKSLEILSDLARNSGGKIEVILRGRPAYDQMPDFDRITSQTPHLRYVGPYKNPDDLEDIYREVHFSWAIDMYEEGLNSSWLLPNRLYEGGLYAAVPLALNTVETGRYLEKLGLGLLLENPLEQSLQHAFDALTPEQYTALETAAREAPPSQWCASKEESKDLVNWLQSLTTHKETAT